LAVSAAEMAFAGGYGLELDLRKVPQKALTRDDFVLFSESNSRFLVEVSEKSREDFEALMKGKLFAEIGEVTKTPRLCIHGLKGKVAVDASLKSLRTRWKKTLSGET